MYVICFLTCREEDIFQNNVLQRALHDNENTEYLYTENPQWLSSHT